MKHYTTIKTIADSEQLSRLVFEPNMILGSEWRENGLFQFQSKNDRNESAVWTRYARTNASKHRYGYKKEFKDRLPSDGKKSRRYRGFLVADVGKIREISSRGHGFEVNHAPAEGIHHVHIHIPEMPQNDRKRIKQRLESLFKSSMLCAPTDLEKVLVKPWAFITVAFEATSKVIQDTNRQ